MSKRKRYSGLGDVLYNQAIDEIGVVVAIQDGLQWIQRTRAGGYFYAGVRDTLADYVVKIGTLAARSQGAKGGEK